MNTNKQWQSLLTFGLSAIIMISLFQNCGKPIQELENASTENSDDNNSNNTKCETKQVAIDAYNSNDLPVQNNEIALNDSVQLSISNSTRVPDIYWKIETANNIVHEAFNTNFTTFKFDSPGSYNVYVSGKDDDCTVFSKAHTYNVKAPNCAAPTPLSLSMNPLNGPYYLGNDLTVSVNSPSAYLNNSFEWKIFRQYYSGDTLVTNLVATVNSLNSVNLKSYISQEGNYYLQLSAVSSQAAPCNASLSLNPYLTFYISKVVDKTPKLLGHSIMDASNILGTQGWTYPRATSGSAMRKILFQIENVSSCSFNIEGTSLTKMGYTLNDCKEWDILSSQSLGNACGLQVINANFVGLDGSTISRKYFNHCPAGSTNCTFGRYNNPLSASDIEYNASIHNCNVVRCADSNRSPYCTLPGVNAGENSFCSRDIINYKLQSTVTYTCIGTCDSNGTFKNVLCDTIYSGGGGELPP